MDRYSIGSTVRVEVVSRNGTSSDNTKQQQPKRKRRATIATVNDADKKVCVFLEDEAPFLILGNNSIFVVAPNLWDKGHHSKESGDGDEDVELILPLEDISPLLDFEVAALEQQKQQQELKPFSVWKEQGDTLLRLSDPTSAASFYEAGLQQHSSPHRTTSIGSSIIVNVGGHPKVAEVDCINDDDDSLDIVLLETQEEKTVKRKDILLCLIEENGSDDDNSLQERLLLNLARCLLHLATDERTSLKRRPLYVKSAVLSSTLAWTCAALFHQSETGPHAQTALVLRAQAYLANGNCTKFPQAQADIKRLLQIDPNHVQGRKLQADLERQQQNKIKTDKKLVKEICKLVQTATAKESDENNRNNRPIEQPRQQENTTKHGILSTYSHIPFTFWSTTILLALIISWLFQNGF